MMFTDNLDKKKSLKFQWMDQALIIFFYENYRTERKTLHPQAPDLLDIGSCSLHVVHGGYKTAFDETGWQIGKILRSFGYLFKDSPARREELNNITGCQEFPLLFCSTR